MSEQNYGWVDNSGEMSGRNVIGEVTEAVQSFIKSSWVKYTGEARPPTIQEDLTYESMDRNEQVVFVYMYRLANNPNLQNQKRWRQAPVMLKGDPATEGVYYHRPPVLVDLFYLISAHAKFRSESERILGWLMLALNEATHLIYRPRRFILPNGIAVDSLGRPYDPTQIDFNEDDLVLEKVSLSLVDDLTVGDAVNFFSLHEAPYRPFLTYRARIALDGPLVHAPTGTTVTLPRLERNDAENKGGRRYVSPSKTPEKVQHSTPRHRFKRDTDT